ncbi:AAA family ATPase [Tengunoibacter tsumagoiensis]|uniref:Uncharacterized protein n=1 Tax=Tengunoibacter tsumagoiensis TaxID=2014871 RepID=A0A401ZUC1_9CHLR|nr:AAA family ATPase [Tengunoibacter tsumagoiensis]GCE10515.1 hypothetical protein KTT_03740 [Tengunoibacter tsumagoiensis]
MKNTRPLYPQDSSHPSARQALTSPNFKHVARIQEAEPLETALHLLAQALIQAIEEDGTPTVLLKQFLGQVPESLLIPQGRRNTSLIHIADVLLQAGASDEVLSIALNAFNLLQCRPPLSMDEVLQIASNTRCWPASKPTDHVDPPAPLLQLDTLLAMQLPEPAWIISGLLPEGMTLLTGRERMGKSQLALEFALAIAGGKLALDTLHTRAGGVLFLGLEDSMRCIYERSARLLQGAPAPSNFTWASTWAPLAQGGLADLEEWLNAHPQTRLIVIDPLAKVGVPTTNRSHSREHGREHHRESGKARDYSALTPLKMLAEQHHLSILLVQHLRKQGYQDPLEELLAILEPLNLLESCLHLQGEQKQGPVDLHISNRSSGEWAIGLQFHAQNASWSLLDSQVSPFVQGSQPKIS